MKIIYIAGPMRGYDNYNFDAFDSTEKRLKDEGYIVISPVVMDRLYEGWGKYPPDDFVPDEAFVKRCMKRDLDAIYDVDAIYMLKGWENSEGATAEYSLAKCLGKRILYEI
jgi:hypothetical protein